MGNPWKQWQTLFSWAPKSLQMVNAAMKLRHLLLGRKAVANLDSVLISRDIALPTKVRLVKAMAFPVVMYGCESWTIKKAEHRRTDAFELWCQRNLLRISWTGRRSNQSILKEISLNIHWRTDTLMLGNTEGRRRRRWQRMRWLDGITNSITWVWASSRSWWRPGKPGVLQFMGSQRVGHDWATELNNEEAGYSTVFPGYLNIGL